MSVLREVFVSELRKYCCVLTGIHCAMSMLKHTKLSVGTA